MLQVKITLLLQVTGTGFCETVDCTHVHLGVDRQALEVTRQTGAPSTRIEVIHDQGRVTTLELRIRRDL